MNVLKNISVAILCFLLFLSLTVFGIAYTIQSTVLNPDFISDQIDSIPVSDIVHEFVDIESPSEMPDLEETVYDTIEALEPVVKERIGDTVHAVYDYFPGDVDNLHVVIHGIKHNGDIQIAHILGQPPVTEIEKGHAYENNPRMLILNRLHQLLRFPNIKFGHTDMKIEFRV